MRRPSMMDFSSFPRCLVNEHTMDIKKLTILSALEGLRKAQFTSVDLVRACLSNIKKYNDDYHVLLTVVDEAILLKQAREIDKTDYSRPLAGIPIVIKDLFSTDGLRTTAGSHILEEYVPVYDATVVRKLKEAGAIIVGKANQDAWAHGSTGENSDFTPTGNAYNKEYVAGGSSSGSAVAVALGMGLAATGTDTGGSIRVPASWNNLVGLKPTYGRVSRYGIIAMASSLDSIGHITKTVADSAYALSITAGKDPFDATTGSVPVGVSSIARRADLNGIRIGVAPEYLAVGKKATKGMDPTLEKRTESSLSLLEKLGATIVEISLPNTDAALETYYILCPSEVSSNLGRYDGVRYGNGRDRFGAEAKRRIMMGTYSLSSGYYDAYYKTAQKVRSLVVTDFARAFEKVDAVFAPVTPGPAPKIGEHADDPMAVYLSDVYAVPVNLTGLPAIALPSGFVDGLPVGIQIIGPQWSEEKLFEIGSVYESEIERYKQKSKMDSGSKAGMTPES